MFDFEQDVLSEDIIAAVAMTREEGVCEQELRAYLNALNGAEWGGQHLYYSEVTFFIMTDEDYRRWYRARALNNMR